MKPRALLVALAALVLAAMCVRLGAWQLSRLHQKQRINAAWRTAMSTPAVPLTDAGASMAGAEARRVRVEGAYDSALHVLVSDRWWKDQPGVEVMTPFRVRGGGVVLIDRGWLPAPDGITARPQDCREDGPRAVTGVLAPMADRSALAAWVRMPGDSVTVWSARGLQLDSVRAHLPYAIAPLVLRALPEPGAPASPVRVPPEREDEGMHLAYAFQWFLFAASLLAGAVFVLVKDRPRPASAAPAGPQR